MTVMTKQPVVTFYAYPSVGSDDFRYTFATAKVRSLQTQLLTRTLLRDMVLSENFDQAVDLLNASDYALQQADKNIQSMEQNLLQVRKQTRDLFKKLIVDEPIVNLLRSREDFANLRLALRRKLTEKPIDNDYNDDGSVPSEQFRQIFEEEYYSPFPEHIQEAIERAVLAYYLNKDIRQIDHALDAASYEYRLEKAVQLNSIFLLELFRMRIDLTNIVTLFRLKFTESQNRDVFINGGYVEIERLKSAIDIGFDAISPLFFATPYHHIVEAGASYLTTNNSFLKLEQLCDDHMFGFLKSTDLITAGPQPVIAYFLMKENEIRNVRLILTAKKNELDTRLILDRLGE